MSDRQIVNPKEDTEYTVCRSCGEDLVGGKVSQYNEKYFGEFTHYSQLKGLRLDSDNPHIVTHWQCPHCEDVFARFQ